LYLPYWPAGVGLALLYLALPGLSRADRSWDWLATLTLFPAGAPALSVAWTLQHEALFYTLFGLFYFGRLLWLGLGAWLLLILAWPDASIPLATINLEFMMGIAVALLYRRGIGHWLLLPLAAALIGAWVLIGIDTDHSLLMGLACACAVLQLSLMESRGTIRVPGWLIFLGGASYALYLVHNPTISIVVRFVPHQWPVIIAAGCAASLVVGITYYLLLERPLLRSAAKWWRRPRAAPVKRASSRR
jgi:peptidoglycan/LPS O-acetylase OafA/YrhL